jgi:NAD-dependent SIR2 family protein deacetylase
VDALSELLAARRALVLSGAGISTDSGIPDYRGPDARPRAPMRYQTFVRDPEARRRYWARSSIGWPVTARARPNEAHAAVARLERCGAVAGVLTQNVDGLHQEAGSRRVLELHGSLATVICLDCGVRSARAVLQERMRAANPTFRAHAEDVAPDGDVEIPDAWTRDFVVPACTACGGTLKPDVVFFGENVPRPRVERAFRMLDEADALLVLGSSLTVYSGYRFVRRARERGTPVAIVNDGPTRGDEDAHVRSHGRLGVVLPRLADRLRPLGDAPDAGRSVARGAR